MERKAGAGRCASLVAAFVASLLIFAWQVLTVQYNYAGNWTALFCAGETHPPPQSLAFEHIYRFPDSNGYDGQFYHYIAHDPFLRRGFASTFDSPRLRYRRILVPFLAWILAHGNDRWIDAAYFAVLLCAVVLAVFWTCRIASDSGLHPVWGTAVLFLPAIAVSMDRMTVDAALVALLAGVVLYAQRLRWGIVWWLCVLACFVRETAMLVPAAIAVWASLHRRFRLAGRIAAATIPALTWYAWAARRTPPGDADFLSYLPFLGLLLRIATPSPYPFGPAVNAITTFFDYATLAGIALAVWHTVRHARDLRKHPAGILAFAFAALVAAISRADVWIDAFSFARVFSPLIFLTGVDALRTRAWAGALPLILVAPRIAISFAPQAASIVRGLAGLS